MGDGQPWSGQKLTARGPDDPLLRLELLGWLFQGALVVYQFVQAVASEGPAWATASIVALLPVSLFQVARRWHVRVREAVLDRRDLFIYALCLALQAVIVFGWVRNVAPDLLTSDSVLVALGAPYAIAALLSGRRLVTVLGAGSALAIGMSIAYLWPETGDPERASLLALRTTQLAFLGTILGFLVTRLHVRLSAHQSRISAGLLERLKNIERRKGARVSVLLEAVLNAARGRDLGSLLDREGLDPTVEIGMVLRRLRRSRVEHGVEIAYRNGASFAWAFEVAVEKANGLLQFVRYAALEEDSLLRVTLTPGRHEVTIEFNAVFRSRPVAPNGFDVSESGRLRTYRTTLPCHVRRSHVTAANTISQFGLLGFYGRLVQAGIVLQLLDVAVTVMRSLPRFRWVLAVGALGCGLVALSRLAVQRRFPELVVSPIASRNWALLTGVVVVGTAVALPDDFYFVHLGIRQPLSFQLLVVFSLWALLVPFRTSMKQIVPLGLLFFLLIYGADVPSDQWLESGNLRRLLPWPYWLVVLTVLVQGLRRVLFQIEDLTTRKASAAAKQAARERWARSPKPLWYTPVTLPDQPPSTTAVPAEELCSSLSVLFPLSRCIVQATSGSISRDEWSLIWGLAIVSANGRVPESIVIDASSVRLRAEVRRSDGSDHPNGSHGVAALIRLVDVLGGVATFGKLSIIEVPRSAEWGIVPLPL